MASSRMTINWFSPLPPARTEIAHYSARIMEALANIFDVTLWTDQDDWDKNLEYIVPVRVFTVDALPWAELNRADLNVYHIGNNPQYHGAIWQVCRQHPGIVILHDLALQGFMFYYKLPLDEKTATSYTTLMASHYGAAGKSAAERVCRGEQSCDSLANVFPLFEPAVDNSLGIIVHSRTAFETVALRQKWPVFLLNLPYKEISACNYGVLSQRRREPPFHIIVFGYIGHNRCVDSILAALAALSRKDSFVLDVYGELWIDDLLPERLAVLGLSQHVKFHGYVSETELDAALAAGDLAINLRYPSFGEASSSQLRIWAHALPTIVTRTGWYADQADEALLFVDPENQIEEIKAILNTFLDNPELFAGVGVSGRKILLEKHLPEVYAEALQEVFAEINQLKKHALVNLMVKRVAKHISALSGDMYETNHIVKVSQEIHKAFARDEPEVL